MIVGITGATGIVYGIGLLEMLRVLGIESHLVVSRAGDLTRAHETDLSAQELRELADFSYKVSDVGAALASGSFLTMGMAVAPCSVHTLSEVAYGIGSNLLTRAADVTLKERRPLVLMVRETPLTIGHCRAMVAASESGAIIAPPVPAMYTRPATLQDIVDHSVARVLDLFGLHVEVPRWGETSAATS